MAAIPDEVFRLIEAKVRQRSSMMTEARFELEKAKCRAYYTSPDMERDGGVRNDIHDTLERNTIAVMQAEKKLAEADRWEAVFMRMDELYPKGSDEYRIIRHMYGIGHTQEYIARQMHYERQSIRRKREKWIATCAIYAARAGLLEELDDKEWGREHVD